MKDLVETLRKEFHRSEDYRYAYDEEFANTWMATQIKVLRESYDPPLTQKQLAEKAGMKQSRISELESVSYSSWSISTLRRLARALGVRLVFRFESWGDLLPEVENFSRESLEEPRFEDDPAFRVDRNTAMPATGPILAELWGTEQPAGKLLEFRHPQATPNRGEKRSHEDKFQLAR
jgi:transcriptional regulator with XRE-family HTH domain